MRLSRRELLKATGATAGLALFLPSKLTALATENSPENLSEIAMLIDVSRCISCWWCYAACKNYNNLPETTQPEMDDPPELAEDTWSTLYTFQNEAGEWGSRKHACMHCKEASCESVCPTGAISHNGAAVVIDQEWCIGCGYCVQACPYGVPHKDEHTGTARKCTFCTDRIENGEIPACADACPTGAIEFGTRDSLLEEAKARVNALKDSGFSNADLYGETESGGLHVMYVLTDDPSEQGLPEEPRFATNNTWVKWVSGVIAGAVVAVVPLWLIFKRKRRLKAESGK
ncbi:4Fe-4S dicluster domain-containing protein [Chloroflexota bacterium]